MLNGLGKARNFVIAVLVTALISAPGQALAQGGCGLCFGFSKVAWNIVDSISLLPGLLTGLSYLVGILFGFKAILLVKDHVESPRQTPLKSSAIYFLAGGALLALPIIFEAMYNTVGDTTNYVGPAGAWKVTLLVK